MFDHAGIYFDFRNPDWPQLRAAMASMNRGASLDVVIAPLPDDYPELATSVAEIYGLAPPRVADLDLTVYDHASPQRWQHAFNSAPPCRLGKPGTRKYQCVAVGGTWDHMHWGHRLMLSMAAFTAQTKVIIGVTGSELLVKKQFAEALDSYDTRARSATAFVARLRPDLEVEALAMHDMYGPTATEPHIQALVVSKETSQGGELVNKKREELGFTKLDIIEVALIGDNEGKLSSTDLRREELSRANKN